MHVRASVSDPDRLGRTDAVKEDATDSNRAKETGGRQPPVWARQRELTVAARAGGILAHLSPPEAQMMFS